MKSDDMRKKEDSMKNPIDKFYYRNSFFGINSLFS